MKAVQIQIIDLDELKDIVYQQAKAALQEQLKDLKPQQPEEKYLSRAQVSEMLGVSEMTIYNWTKAQILRPVGIGNRVFYLLSDIQKKLVPINEV
jgi:predicted DNA-binding transcriptional regulator AlpA